MEIAGGRRCLGPPHSDDVHLAAMTQRRHVCLLLDLLAALSRWLFPSDTNIGKLRPRAGRPHLHPASRSAEGRLASRRVCRFSSPPQSAPEFLLSAVGEVLIPPDEAPCRHHSQWPRKGNDAPGRPPEKRCDSGGFRLDPQVITDDFCIKPLERLLHFERPSRWFALEQLVLDSEPGTSSSAHSRGARSGW